MYGRAPLRTPNEARGVRIRASTSIASQALIEEIGADMITLPFSDVLPALQTGLIDAGVTSTIMYSLSGIPKVAPNFILTRHSYDMGVTLISEKWFQSLDAAEQAVYAQGLGDIAEARRRQRARAANLLEQLPKMGARGMARCRATLLRETDQKSGRRVTAYLRSADRGQDGLA
jgi:TRAP-type C4-dicarboxylate transport system substrate-binding protein